MPQRNAPLRQNRYSFMLFARVLLVFVKAIPPSRDTILLAWQISRFAEKGQTPSIPELTLLADS